MKLAALGAGGGLCGQAVWWADMGAISWDIGHGEGDGERRDYFQQGHGWSWVAGGPGYVTGGVAA